MYAKLYHRLSINGQLPTQTHRERKSSRERHMTKMEDLASMVACDLAEGGASRPSSSSSHSSISGSSLVAPPRASAMDALTSSSESEASSSPHTPPSPPPLDGLPPQSSNMIDEARAWLNLDHVDPMSLDVKSPMDSLGFRDLPDIKQETSSVDMLVLDELLKADMAESARFPFVDDFFPQFTGQGFSWLADSSCEAEPAVACPREGLPEASNAVNQPDSSENVAQLFAEWLLAHSISLADLRRIKLKTSTIESAMHQLGGGRRGLLRFIKFVLLWVQNCHKKRMDFPGDANQNVYNSPLDGATFNPSMLMVDSKGGTPTCSVREDPIVDTPCTLAGIGAQSIVSDGNDGVFPDILQPSNSPSLRESNWGDLNQSPQSTHSWSPKEYTGVCFTSNTSLPWAGNLLSPTMTGLSVCPPEHGLWQQHQGDVALHLQGRLQERGGLTPATCSFGGYMGMQGNTSSQSPSLTTTSCTSASLRPSTPAATTRAARKSRMERQRWSVRRQHHRRNSNSNNTTRYWTPPSSVSVTTAPPKGWSCTAPSSLTSHNVDQQLPNSSVHLLQQLGRKPDRNLTLLFQKELKQSDVGTLGRIVLPKKAAETSLPPLELREGVNLVVEDLNSSKAWNVRYRFWPNNKSRMYVLENTGDFVKSYDLEEGDYMMLYCHTTTNKYVIKGVKAECFRNVTACMPTVTADQALENGPAKAVFGYSGLTQSGSDNKPRCTDIFATASESSCRDDTLLAELTEQSLENL